MPVMTTDKASGTTTIVGGRPMRRAVEVGDLPQGVERLLTLAALNQRFRADLLRDPIAAAAKRGVPLDPVEAALLRAAPPEQLGELADALVVPKSPDRRGFVKAVSASIVAMVTGKAFLLCSGCTGIDTWRQDAATTGRDAGSTDGPDQKWTMLAGYTVYLYQPRAVADHPDEGHGVLIALHGEDETCLASVQRWRTAAEYYGFSVVAVSWTEGVVTAATKAQLARDLPAILAAYRSQWSTLGHACSLSSRGGATPIAFAAVYLTTDTPWQGVSFLGGVPDGDWVTDGATLAAAVPAGAPYLCYLKGDGDPEYAQATACLTALRTRGLSVYSPTLSGSLASATLDFSALYLTMLG
jgi:hypothetical protein